MPTVLRIIQLKHLSPLGRSSTNKKSSGFYYNIVFAGCWCIWTPMHISLLRYFGVEQAVAIADGLISTTLLAALCAFVMNNMRYYLPKKEKYLYVLVMSFALGAVWFASLSVLLKYLYRHNPGYLQFFEHAAVVRYAIGFLAIAVNILVSLIWHTQQEQLDETERRSTTEAMAKEAELNKLRQQLQPHFLFNSLNSISALTGQQPEKARHMIHQLSDFLRGSLSNEAQQWISFEEELTYLQLYLEIEKVRFGHRLQSSIDCEPATLPMMLPSMLLQPLLENAIKFGLYDTIGEVAIKLSATVEKGLLKISIENPFDEATAMPLKGTGFGIASVRRRLYLLYGRQDLLQVTQAAGQHSVHVWLPNITPQTEKATS